MNANNKHKRTQKKLHGRHHDPKTSMCSHHLQRYSSVNCNQEVNRWNIIDTDTHPTAQVPKPVCCDQFEWRGLEGCWEERWVGGGGGEGLWGRGVGEGELRRLHYTWCWTLESSLFSGDVLHLSFTSWLCSLCVVCDRAA